MATAAERAAAEWASILAMEEEAGGDYYDPFAPTFPDPYTTDIRDTLIAMENARQGSFAGGSAIEQEDAGWGDFIPAVEEPVFETPTGKNGVKDKEPVDTGKTGQTQQEKNAALDLEIAKLEDLLKAARVDPSVFSNKYRELLQQRGFSENQIIIRLQSFLKDIIHLSNTDLNIILESFGLDKQVPAPKDVVKEGVVVDDKTLVGADAGIPGTGVDRKDDVISPDEWLLGQGEPQPGDVDFAKAEWTGLTGPQQWQLLFGGGRGQGFPSQVSPAVEQFYADAATKAWDVMPFIYPEQYGNIGQPLLSDFLQSQKFQIPEAPLPESQFPWSVPSPQDIGSAVWSMSQFDPTQAGMENMRQLQDKMQTPGYEQSRTLYNILADPYVAQTPVNLRGARRSYLDRNFFEWQRENMEKSFLDQIGKRSPDVSFLSGIIPQYRQPSFGNVNAGEPNISRFLP